MSEFTSLLAQGSNCVFVHYLGSVSRFLYSAKESALSVTSYLLCHLPSPIDILFLCLKIVCFRSGDLLPKIYIRPYFFGFLGVFVPKFWINLGLPTAFGRLVWNIDFLYRPAQHHTSANELGCVSRNLRLKAQFDSSTLPLNASSR